MWRSLKLPQIVAAVTFLRHCTACVYFACAYSAGRQEKHYTDVKYVTVTAVRICGSLKDQQVQYVNVYIIH